MLYILNLFKSLFCFITISGSHNKFIKNYHLPICKNCIHFQASYYTKNNEIQTNNIDRCGKFGKMNIITGEIKYDYAEFCRQDQQQCGENGKYFQPILNTSSTIGKDW
jgi:hypothetical protein